MFTEEQLQVLADLIVDEFGAHQADADFDEICGLLFEDLAGLETASDDDRQSLTDALRKIYDELAYKKRNH